MREVKRLRRWAPPWRSQLRSRVTASPPLADGGAASRSAEHCEALCAERPSRGSQRAEKSRSKTPTPAELNAAAATLQSKGKFSEAGKQSQLARQLAAEINQQSRAVDQYELLSANGLWIEQTYELRKEYLELMRQSYEAAIETADFRNRAEAERLKINGWVSDHTRQKITDIIPAKGIPEDTRLILANAIYFRGTWQHPFDAKQTQSRPFTGAGNQSVPLPMMSMTS